MFGSLFGLFGGEHGGLREQVPANEFRATYQVQSMAMADFMSHDNGGKLVLPPSALQAISQRAVQYPLMFEVTAGGSPHTTHAGVIEFSAEEGMCAMPFWMMEQLGLSEGDAVNVRTTALPLGSFVRLQPMDETFMQNHNPKVVLERALRSWSALTEGDILPILYNGHVFHLRVVDVKPESPSRAISIIEADVEVDFAPHPGYVEPQPDPEPKKPRPAPSTEPSSLFPSSGGMRVNGKPVESTVSKPVSAASTSQPESSAKPEKPTALDSAPQIFKGKALTAAGKPVGLPRRRLGRNNDSDDSDDDDSYAPSSASHLLHEPKKDLVFRGTGHSLS